MLPVKYKLDKQTLLDANFIVLLCYVLTMTNKLCFTVLRNHSNRKKNVVWGKKSYST